ncbi:MAG TPA: RnfH family protein [Xanthomonadaceae bacterium]|nr:RnfH family protein [Xanthomonadaceae bacterium]
MRVVVVYALPERAWSTTLDLPTDATASDALAQAGFAEQVPGFDATKIGYAIFGKSIHSGTLLRDGDRLELLRPLVADPKQARRRRARGGS